MIKTPVMIVHINETEDIIVNKLTSDTLGAVNKVDGVLLLKSGVDLDSIDLPKSISKLKVEEVEVEDFAISMKAVAKPFVHHEWEQTSEGPEEEQWIFRDAFGQSLAVIEDDEVGGYILYNYLRIAYEGSVRDRGAENFMTSHRTFDAAAKYFDKYYSKVKKEREEKQLPVDFDFPD